MTHGSLPVRFLTMRDIEGRDPGSAEMWNLWKEVENCREVVEIFSKQKPDGSWCAGGAWSLPPSYLPKGGYSPVSPKYVTTAWILPILGDMGFSAEDGRIRKACEYMLSFQRPNGFIGEDCGRRDENLPERSQNPCRFAITLIGLGKAGMGGDPRAARAFDLLLEWQREDGGWAFEEHFRQRGWNRSCPFSTYHAAMALYSSGNKAFRDALAGGLGFLARHLDMKEPGEIQRFFYHGHSTVHEFLMLSDLDVSLGARAVGTLDDWLMSMYIPDEGRFRYAGKPVSKHSRRKDGMDARVARYRLYHLIEDDWLTYYMTRISVNLAKHR